MGLAKKLEEKSKTESHLSSTALRCGESAEHLLQFVAKMNTFLGELTAKELKEEDVAVMKPKLESMLKEGAVHSEGLMLAMKSYKKWL